MIDEMTIGDQYQEQTKYIRDKIPMTEINVPSKPDAYKDYQGKKIIALPEHDSIETPTLRKALNMRKSIRQYSKKAMSLEQLSFLLWASNGKQRTELCSLFSV